MSFNEKGGHGKALSAVDALSPYTLVILGHIEK